MLRAMREQCREIAGTSADFKYLVGLLYRQLLQHARLHLRLPHMLALANRNLQIGEGERAVGCGHKIFTLDHVEQVQHLLVQYFPGPDLILDHVETGLFDVHGRHGGLARGGDLNSGNFTIVCAAAL
jgi:hypothetical protein